MDTAVAAPVFIVRENAPRFLRWFYLLPLVLFVFSAASVVVTVLDSGSEAYAFYMSWGALLVLTFGAPVILVANLIPGMMSLWGFRGGVRVWFFVLMASPAFLLLASWVVLQLEMSEPALAGVVYLFFISFLVSAVAGLVAFIVSKNRTLR